MYRSVQKCFSLAFLPAALLIAGTHAATIAATCTLSFSIGQPTCTVANTFDNFAYNTQVSWASQDKCSWVILFALANPGGGISNHQKSVNSAGVTDNCGFDGGVIPCTVTGHRDSGTPTSQLNVWEQSETPDCSGGRNVTVKPSGSSC